MTSQPNKTKKKLNTIDYFIIVAVVLCIAGAALRTFIGSEGNSLGGTVNMENYVISFKVMNIRNSSTEYFAPGEKFYVDSTGQYVGEIAGTVAVTPALFLFEDADGKYIQAYAPENGDATRIDMNGTLAVKGYMSDNGFLVDGTVSLAPGKNITLRSSSIRVEVTITDIAKVS